MAFIRIDIDVCMKLDVEHVCACVCVCVIYVLSMENGFHIGWDNNINANWLQCRWKNKLQIEIVQF